MFYLQILFGSSFLLSATCLFNVSPFWHLLLCRLRDCNMALKGRSRLFFDPLITLQFYLSVYRKLNEILLYGYVFYDLHTTLLVVLSLSYKCIHNSPVGLRTSVTQAYKKFFFLMPPLTEATAVNLSLDNVTQ